MMHAEELSRLFAAERAVRPPPAAIEHGLARLLPLVAANVVPLQVAGGGVKLTWTAVSKWILVGFVVGLAGSGAAARVWTPAATRAGAVPSVATRVAAPGVVVPVRAVPDSSVSLPAPSAEAAAVAHTSVRAAVEPAPSNEPARFDAELRLITLAKSELDAGRPHLAKAWLAEHVARFPRGVFATDRDALSVLADCSERHDEAAARRFSVAHPGSPMIERLLKACRPGDRDEKPNENSVLEEPTHE
jgi:hypothetical protein